MFDSSFGDGTCSCVLIVNGINKYVTEMTQETQENHIGDIGDSTGKLVAKARPKTNISADDFSSNGHVTIPPGWLDWRRSRSVRQELFRSVKEDDQIASTRSFSTSRRRRSSRIQNLGTDVSCRTYVFSVLVYSNMAELLAKRGGLEKRCQFCVDPYSADTILYFRAIQGRSGGKHINLTLQDNLLLPSDFASTSHHVWNFHDTHPIIQSGLIPSGKDVKKGRHAVFFTAVNPTFIDHCRERDYDVTKPRIAVYKHKWKIHQNTVYWCNLMVAQSKGLQFYQTRSNAIILHNTLPAMCIEKVVIRKSGEELYSKTYHSPTAPQRTVLKPNLPCERQDTRSSDASTSFDLSSKHNKDCDGATYGTYNESCRGEIAFRIQGLFHSAVQEHDHIRKKAVPKMIHQFETHPKKEALHLRQQVKNSPGSDTVRIDRLTQIDSCLLTQWVVVHCLINSVSVCKVKREETRLRCDTHHSASAFIWRFCHEGVTWPTRHPPWTTLHLIITDNQMVTNW